MPKTNIFTIPIIRFGLVGATSTLVDIFTLNLLLHLGVNVYLSVALGFLAGSINGYVLNSKVVFHRKETWWRYAKYLIISAVGLAITELIIHLLFVRWTLMGAIEAKLVAACVILFWNYLMSKIWAFK